MNAKGARAWQKQVGNLHYSIFKDAHPSHGIMGWAAQILRMPDEECVTYRWRATIEEARKVMKELRKSPSK